MKLILNFVYYYERKWWKNRIQYCRIEHHFCAIFYFVKSVFISASSEIRLRTGDGSEQLRTSIPKIFFFPSDQFVASLHSCTQCNRIHANTIIAEKKKFRTGENYRRSGKRPAFVCSGDGHHHWYSQLFLRIQSRIKLPIH